MILGEIQNGTIDRVDVRIIPEDINTFMSISPQVMEFLTAEYSIKLSKENVPQLLASITALKPKQEQNRADLRWGFWFLDRSGKRLHSIFIDGEHWYAKRRRGYIDGNYCNLSSALIHWVHKRNM